MCVIKINLNVTTPVGTTITNSQGRYRKVGATTWNNFIISLSNPETPNIINLGQYELEVNVTNNLGVTSNWANSSFEISSTCNQTTPTNPTNPTEVLVYQYTGVYQLNDPAHPSGGYVNYVDLDGFSKSVKFIWVGDCVTISASTINQTGGVVVGCSNTTTTQYTGIYEYPDPVHSQGGCIKYIDKLGVVRSICNIYFGDCVTIEYISIITKTGVINGCDVST